ncbi:Arabinoxylan arabinofuranohydrolase precursor [Limihaloglobus sulfuriphilus]|uniref:Arabinoxylan arabinofuranohydrolase n=1 Tax=Limihaloglobus sulfuriphilus TaxID=1851148 RepID=A0A1Q2MDG7_9BACT|nr:carbohydrate-binding protein [Limihaloglobus sulfuriphilus]AQQ70598.1 Arabinoxylan arabinofuranohydrolase precursor [Limihaloglobus sulfuriphilus]
MRLPCANGGAIEVRLDNPDGPILGLCEIPNTGGWQDWQTFKIDINPINPSHGISLTFVGPEINDLPKAVEQLAVIDCCLENTENPAYRARLEKLRCRIQATHDHIVLEQTFPYAKWNDLPSAFESWARNFTHRVDDISSLGNVQSSQNRFVQLRYLGMENSLRQKQQVKAPAYVTAKGTKSGALIQWRNRQDNVIAFNVYRDGEKVNEVPLGADTRSYTDRADGVFEYTVTAIGDAAAESPHSVASKCLAGDADDEAPLVVVISEPVSVRAGQSVEITARILDGRS